MFCPFAFWIICQWYQPVLMVHIIMSALKHCNHMERKAILVPMPCKHLPLSPMSPWCDSCSGHGEPWVVHWFAHIMAQGFFSKPTGFPTEWLRASNSSSGAITGVWVRIAVVTLLFLSKILSHNCFFPPRGKWVPARVEVGIVYEKLRGMYSLYRELRNIRVMVLALWPGVDFTKS